MIQLITHTDLDGVACRVVAERVFGKWGVDCFHINPPFNKLPDITLRDALYITDLCPSKDLLTQLIDSGKLLRVIDHHDSALWANEYAPAVLVNTKRSAAFLFYNHLLEERTAEPDGALQSFVELVDVYDRWVSESPLWQRAQNLNRLLWIMGMEMFVDVFRDAPEADLQSHWNRLAVEAGKRDREQVCDIAAAAEIVGDVAYCVVTSKASQVGNYILQNFPSVNVVAMPNPLRDSVELRSRKQGADVAAIAKASDPGGGGHQPAAGFPCQLSSALLQIAKDKLKR